MIALLATLALTVGGKLLVVGGAVLACLEWARIPEPWRSYLTNEEAPTDDE